MKGRDNKYFWSIIIVSLIIGTGIYNVHFSNYSDLITFLSIMIGFKTTSLSILFHSSLKKTLYDRKIKLYGTELHRLKDFYKHALLFEATSVLLFFIIPDELFSISIKSLDIVLGRYMLILPVLFGVFYCFYKILYDMLKIFTYPTNE